jgi:hypothetical protein
MVLDQGQRKGPNPPDGCGRHCAHGEVADVYVDTKRGQAAHSTEAKVREKARVDHRYTNSGVACEFEDRCERWCAVKVLVGIDEVTTSITEFGPRCTHRKFTDHELE